MRVAGAGGSAPPRSCGRSDRRAMPLESVGDFSRRMEIISLTERAVARPARAQHGGAVRDTVARARRATPSAWSDFCGLEDASVRLRVIAPTPPSPPPCAHSTRLPAGSTAMAHSHSAHEFADHVLPVASPHARGAESHAGHDKHAGHSVAMFRNKFWISLLLTIPTLVWGEMIQRALGFTPPAVPGARWIPAGLRHGGVPLRRLGVPGGRPTRAARPHCPGMMTLISLAISVAFAVQRRRHARLPRRCRSGGSSRRS